MLRKRRILPRRSSDQRDISFRVSDLTVLRQNRRWHFENGRFSTITFRPILSFWASSDYGSGISYKNLHNVRRRSSAAVNCLYNDSIVQISFAAFNVLILLLSFLRIVPMYTY